MASPSRVPTSSILRAGLFAVLIPVLLLSYGRASADTGNTQSATPEYCQSLVTKQLETCITEFNGSFQYIRLRKKQYEQPYGLYNLVTTPFPNAPVGSQARIWPFQIDKLIVKHNNKGADPVVVTRVLRHNATAQFKLRMENDQPQWLVKILPRENPKSNYDRLEKENIYCRRKVGQVPDANCHQGIQGEDASENAEGNGDRIVLRLANSSVADLFQEVAPSEETDPAPTTQMPADGMEIRLGALDDDGWFKVSWPANIARPKVGADLADVPVDVVFKGSVQDAFARDPRFVPKPFEKNPEIVRLVWPNPERDTSDFYLERLYRHGESMYRLDLITRSIWLGSGEVKVKTDLIAYGFRGFKAGSRSMMNPVVRFLRSSCRADGGIKKGKVKAKRPHDFARWAGIERQYFLMAMVPEVSSHDLLPSCELRSIPQKDQYGRNRKDRSIEVAKLLSLEPIAVSSKGVRPSYVAPRLIEGASSGSIGSPCESSCYGYLQCIEGVCAPGDYESAMVDLGLNPFNPSKELAELATDLDDDSRVKMMSNLLKGDQHHFIFAGPKDIGALSAAGHDLVDSLDFGWFTPLCKPLLWLMEFFYKLVPNWAIAILLLTVSVKLLLLYWTYKSYVSMREMQRLKPKMDELKERYKEDRQKLNKAMMDLYKRNKVNPLGGCLPMLIQLPIYFALYRTIYAAPSLYQADLFLWIKDLSEPDPFFLLPVLLGVIMLLQQRLSSATMSQNKMLMYGLPVMFTFMMLFLPSGLVYYILVNSALSIAQQSYIYKKGGLTKPEPKKKTTEAT